MITNGTPAIMNNNIPLVCPYIEEECYEEPTYQTNNTAVTSSNANSISVNLPTGVAVGDLLIAAVATDDNENVSAHAHWTLIDQGDAGFSGPTLAVYYRIATGSELSNYTFTIGGTEEFAAAILRYSGVHMTTPIFASASNTGNSTSVDAQSVSATANSLIVRIFATDENVAPFNAGDHTKRIELESSNNDGTTLGIAEKQQTTTGTTGTVSFDLNTINSEEWRVLTIVLAPKPSSTAPNYTTLDITPGTCTAGAGNNDAAVTLSGISNATKAGISTAGAGTYDGATFGAATNIVGGSITFINLMSNEQYIIRLYSSEGCYTDVTITTIINCNRYDFGDLPNTWPQASAAIGAPDVNNNGVPDGNNGAVWAGSIVDAETTQQFSECATGDDTNNFDDEDGLTLPGTLFRGVPAQFTVVLNSNQNGKLVYYGLWFDWDNNMSFSDAEDGFYSGSAIVITANSPVNALFNVTPPLTASDEYKVRLIVSDMPITSGMYANNFSNGEVEDYCKPVTLPIELIGFNASLTKEQQVHLKWRTATEKNNAYFSIQRSRDGVKWEEIAQKKGAGDSYTVRSYDHTDPLPMPGYNYYRLQQFDFDGASSFSPIRVVAVQGKPSDALVFPNPTSSVLYVQLNDDTEVDYQLEVFNVTGQRMKNLGAVVRNGAVYTIDTAELMPGTYFLRMADAQGQNVQVLRFTRQ